MKYELLEHISTHAGFGSIYPHHARRCRILWQRWTKDNSLGTSYRVYASNLRIANKKVKQLIARGLQ